MGRRTLLLGGAGLMAGVAAEQIATGWDDPARWLPDLIVGWTFIVCGLVGWTRRPESRFGCLSVVTGFAWFLGNLSSIVGPIGWLGEHGVFLYLGSLIHCVLTFPSGRASSRLDGVSVIAGYVAVVAIPLAGNVLAAMALGAVLIAVTARGYALAIGASRRARAPGLRAAVAIGLALIGGGVLRLLFPGDANEAVLLAYQIVLCSVAIGLLVSLIRAPWERTTVADLVIGLAEDRTRTLRDALARSLGDPTIEVGYAIPGSDGYVDIGGRPVTLPRVDAGRAVTPIELDGRRIGVLVHDPAVVNDPGLLASIASAASLTASNARLQARVRAQVAEVEASRRRLLVAADVERGRLERRLRDGAERRLVTLGDLLGEARVLAESAGAGETFRLVEQAEGQLQRTLDDLHELAGGLHPAALEALGLQGALAELGRRSPVPVELHVEVRELPPDIRAAAYYLCSEALTNMAKHAQASVISIRIGVRAGALLIDVADDGVGGAQPDEGTGLRGLADRVEALGGSLVLHSPAGQGTRLTAEIPLDGGSR